MADHAGPAVTGGVVAPVTGAVNKVVIVPRASYPRIVHLRCSHATVGVQLGGPDISTVTAVLYAGDRLPPLHLKPFHEIWGYGEGATSEVRWLATQAPSDF